MKKVFYFALIALALSGCSMEKPAKSDETITILWAKWAPADYLQKLSEGFTKETGVKVIVKQVPWENFGNEFFSAVKEGSNQYDMVGGDSQWLGRGASEGIYTDISKWAAEHYVIERMTESAVAGYVEYPATSKRYWGVPLMGDAMGFAYRKDLFESPNEKKAFHQRYGYDLAVPKTWEELYNIAEFFYRPQQGFYGVNVWASQNYDAVTMGVDTLVWAYGGDIGDRKTYRVKGILDVPASGKGLEMYKAIHKFGAPEWKSAYLEANDAFVQGKVAMVMSFIAFFPDLLDPQVNPYAQATGFFANPSGPAGRFTSLGGQGLSILSSTSKKELCLKFLEWFVRRDVQREWANLGGFSCDKAVLGSQGFLKAKPYNTALAESMVMMRDFWAVPEYLELLEVSQKHWHDYLFSDELSADNVNAVVAREWENIFEAAGYYKE